MKKPLREGKAGKGVFLRQLCGFCGSRMRSVSQRTKHAKDCKEVPSGISKSATVVGR